MSLRSLTAAALAALLLAACGTQAPKPAIATAHAPVTTATPAAIDEDAGYLAPAELPDAIAFLPPPPAADSAALRLDEDTARAALSLQGSPRWAQAAEDAEYRMPESVGSFECALGLPLGSARTPATLRLLSRVRQDVSVSSKAVKSTYQRPRPFMQNGQPICRPGDTEFLRGNGAYPSGHAMLGWMWAMTLGDVLPDRAPALFTRGRNYGESRVVCNVHWQSDVQAGRDLADLVASRIRAQPRYRHDVDAARAELLALQASGAKPARDCAAESEALRRPALPANW